MTFDTFEEREEIYPKDLSIQRGSKCKPDGLLQDCSIKHFYVHVHMVLHLSESISSYRWAQTKPLVCKRCTVIVNVHCSFTHSYPTWCSPCTCVFNLILPQHAALFCQLFLIHADVIPAAKPLATLAGAQGRPRSTSKVADHRSVKGSSRGRGGSGSGEWNFTESCKNCLWGSAGTKTTQKERAQAQK